MKWLVASDNNQKLGAVLSSDIHKNATVLMDKLLRAGFLSENEKNELTQDMIQVLQFLKELLPSDIYNRDVDIQILDLKQNEDDSNTGE